MPHIAMIILVVILCIGTRNYKKEEIGKPERKEHPLRILYPTAYWISEKMNQWAPIRHDAAKKEKLQAIYAAINVENAKTWYTCKVISFLIMIILLTNFMAICVMVFNTDENVLKDGRYLIRPGVNEAAKEVNLGVRIHGKTKVFGEELLEVEARRYTEAEARETMGRIQEELASAILGENEKTDRVVSDLNLISGRYGIRIEWETDGKYVGIDGRLSNKDVGVEGVAVTLKAIMTYGEWEEAFDVPIVVYPPSYTDEERFLKKVKDAITEKGKESMTEEAWELPDVVDGDTVTYSERKGSRTISIMILGALCLMGTPYLLSMELENKLKKRNREMLVDYPEVMNKFILLLGAGMTMKGAWGKITSEYVGKRKKGVCPYRYVYEEMLVTWNEIINGQMERTAYERFGRRVRLAAYSKFSTLISQNMKKGNSRLLSMLELEAMDAWEERRETVKRLGEEASSKLLLPMFLLFGIVLAVILFPAIVSL